MASAKRLPKVSKISRAQIVAYARKQKSPGDPDAPGDRDEADDAGEETAGAPGAEGPPAATTATTAEPAAPPISDPRPTSSPAIVTPVPPAAAVPAPAPPPPAAPIAAAPPAEKPAEPPRARSETVAMPVQASIGAPPEMPGNVAPVAARIDAGAVESPTQMPGPREIPTGNPEDPAAAPGIVPRGDSRSMRRRAERYEFALIYRLQTFIITRFGVVGTRGQWRVVEYPTSTSAGHAYAKEVSRFVSDGFSDYRE
jgi:hypothetical protein